MKPTVLSFEQLMHQAACCCLEKELEEFSVSDGRTYSVSKKTDRKIRHMICRETMRSSRPIQYLKIAAVAVLIVGTVGFVTCMSIPTVRAEFWAAVTTLFDDHIGIRMEAEEPIDYPKTIEEKRIPVIPEGWEMEIIDDWAQVICYIDGSAGQQITFVQKVYNEGEDDILIDNDLIGTEQISLTNHTSAYLYNYDNGTLILIWLSDYFFYMVTDSTDRDTLISIAESIAAQ